MKNKSFTLIELLVVIVIIGILAGVIIISISSSISKANFAKGQSFSNTVQNELLGDLVSEWTFDNASNPGEDTWSNNDGTNYGATYKPKTDGVCVYGGCYSFDGSNDYIDLGNDASLNIQNNDFSISAWVKLSSKWGHIICKRANFGTAIPFQFLVSDNNDIEFSYYNTTSGWTGNYGGSSLKDNQWYFATVSYFFEGNGISKIYVDGKEYSTKYHTFLTQNDLASKVRMGSWSDTAEMFEGLIDDVRIYNAALSSAQIKQQYVAGLNSLLANNALSKEEYLNKIENLSLND